MIDYRKLLYLFLSFVITFTFIATIGISINSVSPKVIGGKNAPPGRYPYMASLKLKGNHVCGGSILNERWILTAAHCIRAVEHYFHGGYPITVVVGTNRLSDYDYRQEYYVDYMKSHDNWTERDKNNDVGLIHVKNDINFNRKIQKIKLPREEFKKFSCYPATVSGWGLMRSDTNLIPDILQEITLKVIPQFICKIKFNSAIDINKSHLCTYTKYGEGICRGDSGSPLVADGVQIGIASFVAIPCAGGRPDVFTRVYTFLDWINDEQAAYKANYWSAKIQISNNKSTSAIIHDDQTSKEK